VVPLAALAAAGERNVVIPFAEQLADGVLALAVRQRREFRGALLMLIRAHALLHRASRNRSEAGAIIATIEDYAAVRELVADLFSEGIEAMVSTTVRETVDAISALNKHEVSLGELAAKLGLDKSAVSRRLRQATELGVPRQSREHAADAPPGSRWAMSCRTRCMCCQSPTSWPLHRVLAVLHYGAEGIVDGIVSHDDPEGLTPALNAHRNRPQWEDATGIEDTVPSQVAVERIQHWFDARRT